MLTHLKLERFKNFKDVNLNLGPFNLLIGVNASGKSNIRDAFRFLHGVSRGYKLADIMGEKYGEGGILQWRGIRGGVREATYLQSGTFAVTVHFSDPPEVKNLHHVRYAIEVDPGFAGNSPRVIKESLYVKEDMIFDSHPSHNPPAQSDIEHITVRISPGGNYRRGHSETFIAHQPVLTQIVDRITTAQRRDKHAQEVLTSVKESIHTLNSMRFLDLDPDAMRMPSFPGQIDLGDRGENLSSVLQDIYHNPQHKKALIEWIRELTPMDVGDFQFIPDQIGRILVALVEENGRPISAYSASDGTLRFLAMIAALFGPKPARFYFFEELDNGLHPARLHLLLQLVERKTSEGSIQIVATTHSPQLLRFLNPTDLEHTSLVYRLPNTSEGRIQRIVNMPDFQNLVKKQDVARLHESAWFENVMTFLEREASDLESGASE